VAKRKSCFWLEDPDKKLVEYLSKKWRVSESTVVRSMIRYFKAYPEKLSIVEVFAVEEEWKPSN
jgi:hypothetical protein